MKNNLIKNIKKLVAKKESGRKNLGKKPVAGITLGLEKIEEGLEMKLVVNKTGNKYRSFIILTLNKELIAVYDLECAEDNFWPMMEKISRTHGKLMASKRIR